MMKILLINPPFDYSTPDVLIKEPLSLAYLAAYLKKFNYSVEILDAVAKSPSKTPTGWHYGLSDSEIKKEIIKSNPTVVGITCPFSIRIKNTLRIAGLVKEINKNIITVAGGIYPTIFPKETIEHKEVDFLISGEGEESFLNLIRQIELGNFSDIKVDGCAYKKNGKAIILPKSKYIENLDKLPFPARELLPMEFYFKRPTVLYGLGAKRAASIISSRSCPKGCTFCCMNQLHGKRWRARSAENVLNEIKFLINKYKVDEIFFMDDNLTFDKTRIMKLCKLIIKEKIRFKWNTPNGVAADRLDEKLLRLMKKAGCVSLAIGVESGNEEIRNKVIKKGLSEKIIIETLKACKKVKMPIVGFFILGIPGENDQTFKDTLRMVREFPFSMVATSFYTPFPGTELYDHCISRGYLDKDFLKKIDRFNIPIVETENFDKKKLRSWEKQFYLEFFKTHFFSVILDIFSSGVNFFKWYQIKRFLREKIGL